MTLDAVAGRFAYTEDHEAFRQTVRSFLAKEGVPHVAQWEADRLVPKDFWVKAGEIGMLCPTVPEAYGGLGLDFGYNAIVDEELAYADVPAGFSLHSDIVSGYIEAYGSE
jgi:acyl-CoA dehydrogenase